MVSDSVYLINVFSTLSVALPILLGMIYLKDLPKAMVFFMAFLIFGFAVDLMGWYNYHYPFGKLYLPIREVYWFVDFSFYAWFLFYISKNQMVKVVSKAIWLILFLAWLAHFYDSSLLDFFKLSEGVSFSFLSGFILLEIVEHKKGHSLPLKFWLVFGVFFYHFGSFFIMGMISSAIGTKVWYLHNVINITTNLIYSLGFYFGRDISVQRKMG